MEYPVVIHHDKGTAYGVTIPDIPGCFSAGDTLTEALHNAKEAICGHLEILAEDEDDIPEATEIDNYLGADGILAIVDVDITPYLGHTVRVNITLPEMVLNKIDNFVAEHKEISSRSAFLAQASLKEINSLHFLRQKNHGT